MPIQAVANMPSLLFSLSRALTAVKISAVPPWVTTLLVLGIAFTVKALTGGKALAELVRNLVLSSLLSSFLRAGFVEELVKFLLFLAIVKRLHPKNVYEYAVLMGGVGFGFTVLEELSYGATNAVAGLMRLPGFAMHMVLGLIMGLFLGLARYKKQQGESGSRETCLALLLPMLYHTVYDAASVANVALSSEDDYVQFQGLLVGIVVIAVSIVLQFTLLILFKKRTEKYCGMEIAKGVAE